MGTKSHIDFLLSKTESYKWFYGKKKKKNCIITTTIG
jgi:hypothetical protein